ncbi:MAG: hypothetical protein LH473_13035 [Chitinophagales bacterium]|nr:hypothetical protein [Chitinophagales bacterium]
MEAVIKIRSKELDNKFFKKIKELVNNEKNLDITISIADPNKNFLKELDESIDLLNSKKKLVTFTLDEFLAYTPTRKAQ